MFYRSVIESVVVFGVAVWGGKVSTQDKKVIKRIRTYAERILGSKVPSWESIYTSRVKQITLKILKDDLHPLHKHFEYLPSGRRLRQPLTHTNRYRSSFVPNAIALYNKGV